MKKDRLARIEEKLDYLINLIKGPVVVDKDNSAAIDKLYEGLIEYETKEKRKTK
jgi:hypothetical protein